MRLGFIPLVFVLSACVPLGESQQAYQSRPQKTLIYDDIDYEDQVGLVWVNYNRPYVRLSPKYAIRTTFDLFATEFENLQARLIHCNRDWTPSVVPDMDFLDGFNQFVPKTFNYSVNTIRSYIHYELNVPCPKLSGNYMLVVHRRNNPQDLLFSRRFVVYSDQVELDGTIRNPNNARLRRTHQQIDLDMRYGRLNSPNPSVDFFPVIIQNNDWNRALSDLRPTQIRPNEQQVVWQYINEQTVFPGWSEFRFADLTSITVRGFNVREIQTESTGLRALLMADKSKRKDGYNQLINDRNGGFVPVNTDPGESQAEAAYLDVDFELISPKPKGDVYVMGRFNNWKRGPANKMTYDQQRKTYRWQTTLKQGVYDYRYEVHSDSLDVWDLEGNFYQTENRYDILMYYRNPQNPYDECVGRLVLNSRDFF